MPLPPLKVLIVDDNSAIVRALELLLGLHDVDTVTAHDPDQALATFRREPIGVVVQDMNFSPNETSGAEGARLFRALRDIESGLPIVLMTAWASVETAVELVRDGAADYFEKPWNDDRLVASVTNLLRLRSAELENARLHEEQRLSRQVLAETHDLCDLVYASDGMHRVLSLAVQIAGSNAPVLITGPSGSGKERIAEVVQANSRRRQAPFVRVNVGAIPAELMEAELFGAEAGAYTGQIGRRVGHFEAADGGTLFLDEIDSLPLAGQVKLLRVLQSGEIQRLGSSAPKRVDVRVLSATNAQLDAALASGRFREDLFFRLNVVELEIPALNDRPQDILPLAEHFLELFDDEHEAGHCKTLSEVACEHLRRHDWPGNVRELENKIRRAILTAAGPEITSTDLGFDGPGDLAPVDLVLDRSSRAERQELLAILSEEQGVVSRAADRLNISRQALYRKMARLDIELERRPKI